MFHLSHFHRLVRFCWFGLVVGGVCLCFFAFLLTTDQPVRSSYQPMTIIAYLRDCHCRYDERSNVQKKSGPHQIDTYGFAFDCFCLEDSHDGVLDWRAARYRAH